MNEDLKPDRRLRDINIELKNKSDEDKPGYRPTTPRPQGIRAQFYYSNQDFMFNAYLNHKPEKGDIFSHNGNLYIVGFVTRQLEPIREDGSLVKERSMRVVVQDLHV